MHSLIHTPKPNVVPGDLFLLNDSETAVQQHAVDNVVREIACDEKTASLHPINIHENMEMRGCFAEEHIVQMGWTIVLRVVDVQVWDFAYE